jgi:hypothetical protein
MTEIDKNIDLATAHALDKYKNHLEFLGYLVEEQNEVSISAKHQRRETLHITKFGGDIGVQARIVFAFPNRFRSDPIPLYVYANDLNMQFYFMKASVRPFSEGGFYICMDSVLEGSYDRKNFSIFLDNIEHDMHAFNDYIKTNDIFAPDESGEVSN